MRLICAMLMVAWLGCDESAPKPAAKTTSSHLCTDDCLPVPQGIKGLTFGMSFERANEALGGAKILRPTRKTRIRASTTSSADYKTIPYKLRRQAERKARQTLPGKLVKAKTTLGTEPAVCTLSFAVRDALSHIACEITSAKTKKDHDRVINTIRTRLEKRHGAAEVTGTLLSWRDEEARLLLFARGRAVVLANTSAAHLELISELRAKATQLYHAELDAYLANTKATAAERAAKAKKAAKAWDRDLSPAAEK